jgi:hypothetical protein
MGSSDKEVPNLVDPLDRSSDWEQLDLRGPPGSVLRYLKTEQRRLPKRRVV